jgi:pantoate--beta-alanine ligase
MQHAHSLTDLRQLVAEQRRKGASIGFVPTMGALHEGHIRLVETSLRAGHATLVSIFVNPTQFGPNEDYSRYPRTLEEDAGRLQAAGAQLLFAPKVEDIYPEGFSTEVKVRGIPDHLCGPFRPGHFAGVATVVTKLLNMAEADAAYFGEKDWQQLQLIRRLAVDLDISTAIHGVPTVRETDGLALSSRNRYLGAADRARAALIPQTLQALAEEIRNTPEKSAAALARAKERLLENSFTLDYLELADAASCAPVKDLLAPARVFIAARIGGTRLIDNWPV